MSGTRQDGDTSDLSLTPEQAHGLLANALSKDEATDAGSEEKKAAKTDEVDADEKTAVQESDTPPKESEDQTTDEEEEGERRPLEIPADHRIPIVVDGENVEVTFDELRRGYSRTSDYTRKTQLLAEGRKALDGELGQTRQQRAKYAEMVEKISAALERAEPTEPDWEKVRRETPDQYSALWTDWQRYKERARAVDEARRQAVEEEEADQTRQRREYVASEHERLLTKLPDWKDGPKREAGMRELVEYGRQQGFQNEDLAPIADHRVILLLRKAMLYDRLQAARPDVGKKIEKKSSIRTVEPGSPRGTTTTPEKERVAKRFAKSGSQEDAIDLLRLALSEAKPPRE